MRISVPHLVARLVVAPIVAPFLSAYPDIVLEVIANDAFVDIVKQGFEALIRLCRLALKCKNAAKRTGLGI